MSDLWLREVRDRPILTDGILRLKPTATFVYTLTCLAILLVGVAYEFLPRLAHADVGRLLQFAAGVLFALPRMLTLMASLISRRAEPFSDQLVVFAVWGALATGEYVTAAIVSLIVDIGHWMEQIIVRRSDDAALKLKELSAKTATVLSGGMTQQIDVAELHPGDILCVYPNEVFAVDGDICWGTSTIDESAMTGEYMPRDVAQGDSVLAGSSNLSGVLHVTATRVGEDTSMASVAQLLVDAVQTKNATITALEEFAEVYLPAIALLAGIVFVVTQDPIRVLTMFVTSCPCALAISGPTAMLAAITAASNHGVVIRNMRRFQALAAVDTAIFDKTGTLTHGRMEVVEIHPIGDMNPTQLMELASLGAHGSRHPVCQAILRSGLVSRNVPPQVEVIEFPGLGVQADGPLGTILLGKPSWLRDHGMDLPPTPEHEGPVVAVGQGADFRGFLLLRDQLRVDAARTVSELRALGLTRIVLLTGDRMNVARAVGDELGMSETIADALPQDKLAFIKAECKKRHQVVAVGDGINDVLALAAATVGIALGSYTSDIISNSADILLMDGTLQKIPDLIRLARHSRTILYQNIGIAMTSSVLLIAAGACGLISPITGAALHHLGTFTVLGNSMRLGLGYRFCSAHLGTHTDSL